MNNADILINRVNIQVGVFFGKEEVSSSILDIGSAKAFLKWINKTEFYELNYSSNQKAIMLVSSLIDK